MRLGIGISLARHIAVDIGSAGSGALSPLASSGAAATFDPSLATGVVSWWDTARSTITQSGGVASQINDLIATNHLVASGSGRPTYTASGIGGTPELLFDGVANKMLATFTLNNPMWTWIVFASVAYGTSGVHDILMDGISTPGAMVIGSLLANGATPTSISSGNALSNANPVPNGTLTRMICKFGSLANGGSMSFLDSTGVERNASGNTGTNNAGGITLGCLQNGTRFYNFKFKELAVGSGVLSAGDLASFKAYGIKKYSLAA